MVTLLMEQLFFPKKKKEKQKEAEKERKKHVS